MTRAKTLARSLPLLLVILPAVHVFLVVLTIMLSSKTSGGAYYRIFGVDPLAAVLMVVYDDTTLVVVGVLLVVGTAWWYFIGRIGWESSKGRISRLSSALGAVLALFFGVMGIAMSKDVFYQDLRDGALTGGAILQYVCVGTICVGAFVTACYSTRAALRSKRLMD
jgi:hypothetical protein